VPERYEAAQWEELAAWRQVTALAQRQRQALLGREAQQLDTLREELQAQLGAALAAHTRSMGCREAGGKSPLQHEVEEALRLAHGEINLNLQLLRDTCSYLQMMRTAVVSEALPAGYGQTRTARPDSTGNCRVA